MHIAFYIVALLLGLTTTRTATVMARGGVEPTHIAAAILGFAAMASTFGILALGFVLYSWWVPIACCVGLSLVVGAIVSRDRLAFFHSINPVLGICTIALCVYGWWAWLAS